MKPRAPSEKLIQEATIRHWQTFGLPDTLVAAVPNARAHGQPGLTRGLFDLIVLSPTLGAHTGWLELKAEGGALSADQKAFRELLIKLRIVHGVAYGRDQPIARLEAWGAVRPGARP